MLDTLLQLLANDPGADVDLAEVALLLARDEYADLDVDQYLARIDEIAELVAPVVPDNVDVVVEELTRILFRDLDYHGNSDDYYDPRNSYLNDVLDRRVGIPITLSILAIAVGRRIGVDIFGVGLPGHFIAKAVGDDGEILFDPFHGGRFLSPNDCEQLVESATGRPFALTPDALAPTPTGLIVSRMLNNLRAIYTQREDFPRMARVLGRMWQLSPGDMSLRRDLGAALHYAGKPGQAIDHLRVYLEQSPYADDSPSVRALLNQALSQVAKWN
jgi:regulator of sirC expression with transglutaminase-like and TPR domain